MARRWTKIEEREKRKALQFLYVKQNRTIGEIAGLLEIKESTVYDRLIRLNIPISRFRKPGYNNINRKIFVPKVYTAQLAGFIGILLGDGHLSPTQVTVTLGFKDELGDYVVVLIEKLFHIKPKRIVTNRGDQVIYFGSTVVVRWLRKMGLVYNKVKFQVDIPKWCFSKRSFIESTIRGLIDTDGSVYRIRSGLQISFCNRSRPLLQSVRRMFLKLGYRPSKISGYNIYLTRRLDLLKYFKEIGFNNGKNKKRFMEFYPINGRFV